MAGRGKMEAEAMGRLGEHRAEAGIGEKKMFIYMYMVCFICV